MPLAQEYRAAVHSKSCNATYAPDDARICLEELETAQMLEWGHPDMSKADNLWSDAAWWPYWDKDEAKTDWKSRRAREEAPSAFRSAANWSRDLPLREGCDKYDFNASSFDHMRALYNVSGWTQRIPGVQQSMDDGSFRLAPPSTIDDSGIQVSCQLWGTWDTVWYPGPGSLAIPCC